MVKVEARGENVCEKIEIEDDALTVVERVRRR